MVVIAGGALFLVWQQMQKQQTPAEIKITQESAAKPNEEPVETHKMDTQPAVQDGSGEQPGSNTGGSNAGGSNTSGPGSGERKPPKPKSFAEQINAAMAARKPELLSCINSHPDGIPKGKAIEASISFDAKGHTTSVSLSPADVNASPLGMCLKNAVKKADFPNGRETSFSVPLTPKGA